MDALAMIQRIQKAKAEGARMDAYTAGWDAAVNGANEQNCHFGIFSTPERTREWERGNREGMAAREAQ